MTNPTAQDYFSFEVGGIVFPLAALGSSIHDNSALRDADPSLFFAIDFWTYVIETFVGERIMASFSDAGAGASISKPVYSSTPWPPRIEQLGPQFRFPLLSVYRKTSKYTRLTQGWENDRTEIDLVYVLPQVDSYKVGRITPLLRATAAAIRHKTTQGWDPGYTPPGGLIGDSPWGMAFSDLQEIGFETDNYSYLPGADNYLFPSVTMSGYIIERDMRIPSPNKFMGADVQIDHRSQDGTTVQDIVAFATQRAPTITSVSPSAAPAIGGTPLTVAGTGFQPRAQVLFHGVAASSVVVVSPTSITCTSPVVGGSGSVDVIVVNPDGQSGSSPSAFTYT